MCSSFLPAGELTSPVPRGAGMSRTRTDPHLPVTLQGMVWGSPLIRPQKPRRTGATFSLAAVMAPRMALATSEEHLTPSPMCPAYAARRTTASARA